MSDKLQFVARPETRETIRQTEVCRTFSEGVAR